MSQGNLIIVGTGIQFGAHITAESKAQIVQADKVYFVVTHQLTAEWLRDLNNSAESLAPLYQQFPRRLDVYQAMADRIISAVRQGERVCAVFYGHPGVFVSPSHWVLKQARQEGFGARMLPGISAEDCLFSDLGIDPAARGCQSFEATDFLVRNRHYDPHSTLILWQIATIGNLHVPGKIDQVNLDVLRKVLLQKYSDDHLSIVYEASRLPLAPSIQRQPLRSLHQARFSPLSTLVIPPLPEKSLDASMLAQLGLTRADFQR